jgi:hypothetical protein
MGHLAFRGAHRQHRSSHLDHIGIVGSIDPVCRVGPPFDAAGPMQPG